MARSRARFFRIDSAFPASAPGRHHIGPFEACSSFTRVTACQVARPPFCGLCREVPTRPVPRPNRSIAIESNHQLFEWVLPPLVICPFGAHTRVSAPQTDATDCLGRRGAGTRAQCHVLFRFGSNQNIPNEFCFDAAADRNGPFAIGVGLTVLPPLGVAWRTRGKCLRMNRIERDPEKYVALGTRACSAETHLGARAMRNAG